MAIPGSFQDECDGIVRRCLTNDISVKQLLECLYLSYDNELYQQLKDADRIFAKLLKEA